MDTGNAIAFARIVIATWLERESAIFSVYVSDTVTEELQLVSQAWIKRVKLFFYYYFAKTASK